MSPTPSAGDMTGKIKQQQQHDALQEQRDAAATMSLASAIETQEQQDGVFDPHSQTRLDVPPAAVVEETPLPQGFGGRIDGGPTAPQPPQEQVFTGYETEEQMTPLLATRNERPVPQAILRNPMVKIRVGQDIEDMTYGFNSQGYPNNMTFREGFVYEVDINVADHLNQRGLVAQWVG
jgi:hypothetical protein